MIQNIKKWRVLILIKDKAPIELFVNNNFISNVLRILSDLDFCEGLSQPFQIKIEVVE